MFGFRLQFWWLTRLCETDLAVLLEPDGTLIREYDIVKSLSGFLAFSNEREMGDTRLVSLTTWQYFGPHRFQPSFFLVLLMVATDR